MTSAWLLIAAGACREAVLRLGALSPQQAWRAAFAVEKFWALGGDGDGDGDGCTARIIVSIELEDGTTLNGVLHAREHLRGLAEQLKGDVK